MPTACALAEEARASVRDPRPRGMFRLGSMVSIAAVRLPKLLSDYHRRHSEVSLEPCTGHPGELATAIFAGELVAEPIADAPFDKTFAFTEELVIVSAAGQPPIRRKGPFPASILAFEHGLSLPQAAGATFELDEIVHCIDPENVASQAVARRLGAVHEGAAMLLSNAVELWSRAGNV
jgi:DNA-binding transcriptional LysR family regulator